MLKSFKLCISNQNRFYQKINRLFKIIMKAKIKIYYHFKMKMKQIHKKEMKYNLL